MKTKKVELKNILEEEGPVVLVYKDEGSATDKIKIKRAYYFDNKRKAEVYSKKLVLGKEAEIGIYPLTIV